MTRLADGAKYASGAILGVLGAVIVGQVDPIQAVDWHAVTNSPSFWGPLGGALIAVAGVWWTAWTSDRREDRKAQSENAIRLEGLRRDAYAAFQGAVVDVLTTGSGAHEVDKLADEIAYLTDSAAVISCVYTVKRLALNYEEGGGRYDRFLLKSGRTEFVTLARADLGRGDPVGEPATVDRIHESISARADAADTEDFMTRLLNGEIKLNQSPATSDLDSA